MILYHATTPKKTQRYHASGRINRPVRGFTSLEAALAWAMKVGRSLVFEVRAPDEICHKLPDHHNHLGEAWWIDSDVYEWRKVFPPRGV